MSGWSLDPVGGWLFTLLVAALLVAALRIGPSKEKLSPRRRITLRAMRSITVALLLFAMLRPAVVITQIKQLPASLVLLADRSRSMQITDATGDASRWESLKESLTAARDQLASLAEAWDVKLYLFDEAVELADLDDGNINLPEEPEGPQTAIGAALEDVLSREAQQRIVGVVLLSDGAQRAFAPRDLPPQNVVQRMAVDDIPLYTITYGKPALGLQSDLAVEDLLVSDTLFADSPATVEATVRSSGYLNRSFKAQLLWENAEGEMEVADTLPIEINSETRRFPLTFQHTPTEPGEHKVSVQIETAEGELATSNNQQSTFVTVKEGGLNVLYLVGASRIGGGPGIEPRFVRSALAAHADINIDYQLIDYRRQELDWRRELDEGNYDVYLLQNVDVTAFDKPTWTQMATEVGEGAGLGMLGGFHSFGPGGFRYSPLENVLPITIGRAERQNFGEPPRQDMHLDGPITFMPVELGNQAHPILQLQGDELEDFNWSELPPLDGANRIPRSAAKSNAQIIADTGDARRAPLMIVGAWGEGRTAALAIDSTWRWQLGGYGQVQRRFWRQLVLWLARKDGQEKEGVWVELDGRRYLRGSSVDFSVGAVDAMGQPIEEAKFDVQLEGPEDTTESVPVSQRGEDLVGTISEVSEAGDYRLQVTATAEGEIIGTTEVRFLVPDQDMELDNPAAEPTLLASLANLTAEAGGMGIAPEELPRLLEELESRTDEFEEEITQETTLWDTWPVLLGIVGLLSTEWYLRKRWGLV